MPNTGRNTRRIIQKYAVARTVRHYEDRRNQTYDADGLPVALSFTSETVQIHDQPLQGKMLKYLPEGQRAEDVRRGWTVEADKVKEGDEINIEGFIYTVNSVEEYKTGVYGHKEFNLLKTGEQDNTWI